MKKKTGLAAILFGTGLCLMAGCGNNSSAGNETGESVVDTETQVFFDYNVSDYVTLGDYKNLSVQYPVPVVTDEDVEKEIEELTAENGGDMSVEEIKAEMDMRRYKEYMMSQKVMAMLRENAVVSAE